MLTARPVPNGGDTVNSDVDVGALTCVTAAALSDTLPPHGLAATARSVGPTPSPKAIATTIALATRTNLTLELTMAEPPLPRPNTRSPAKNLTRPSPSVTEPRRLVREPTLANQRDTAERLLRETDVWVVAGLSQNVERAAYGVARVLQSHGKRIVPVHPRAQTVHGEQGYATVEDASFWLGPIDVVDCFVNSRRVGEVVDAAIAVGAKAVWLQLDVIDEDAARRARAAGLDVVMDRCPAIEYRRLGL